MWKPWQWPTDSNRRAVDNARTATTECSRRRVEREEVVQHLASLRSPVAAGASTTRRPA